MKKTCKKCVFLLVEDVALMNENSFHEELPLVTGMGMAEKSPGLGSSSVSWLTNFIKLAHSYKYRVGQKNRTVFRSL